MSEDKWYLKTETGKSGPYTFAELKRLASEGQVTRDSLISKGDGKWIPASEIAASREQKGRPDRPRRSPPPPLLGAMEMSSNAGKVTAAVGFMAVFGFVAVSGWILLLAENSIGYLLLFLGGLGGVVSALLMVLVLSRAVARIADILEEFGDRRSELDE